MSIINDILSILQYKNKTQSELCSFLNINTSTMTNWKNRNTDPPAKLIIPICEFLEISPYYLLTGKEKSSPAEQLSDDEQELLHIYNSLTEKQKGRLLERAEFLMQTNEPKINPCSEDKKDCIFIEFYSLPASAGTGVYLDGDEKEMLEVEKTPLTVQANFALKVKGDSMQPLYDDGDIVLIKSQPFVNQDEIGIFILNGEGYIKMLGKNELISLNSKYKNIKITEDDHCICKGKVLGKLDF